MLNAGARCLLILLSLIVPAPAVSVQQKVDEPSALIAEARVLWQKGQQWPAIDKLKKAIALDPNDAASHTELADMYLGVKSNDLAREAVREALRLNPNYARAHHRNAVLLRLSGDVEGGIREARLALSLNPDDETAAYSHITIGRAFMRLKQITEADEEFRKAIVFYQERVNRKSTDASAHIALGDLLFELQRYDTAEKSYRRALELHAQNFSTLRYLGSALHNQGKKDEAVRYYQEYLRFEPDAERKANIEARIKWLESTPLPALLGHLLINAAENGNLSNVKALLAKGADPNFKNEYKTPLNMAAREGYLEVVKALLAQAARDEDGAALAVSYEEGHSEIEKLVERATPQLLTPKAVNRLLYAALRKGDAQKFASLIELASAKERDELLLYAVSQRSQPPVAIVRLLLDKGANVNQPTRYKTPLMHAASEGYAEIVSLLLYSGAQVNVQTDEGTSLMMAVTGGHTEIVKLLLAAGSDAKATDRMGDQVLIMAARQRSYRSGAPEPDSEIMRLLLANGADPNVRGQWGATALMSANTPAKVKLLVGNRADVNAKDEQGQTALIKAAARGDAGVVDALLENGADVNATDNKGSNALLRSLDRDNNVNAYNEGAKTLLERRLGVAQRLLLAKAFDVNAQNGDGETALMRAVRLENLEIIKSLLAKGADGNRSDLFGDTAVILAYEKGNIEIERLLPTPSLKRQPLNVLNAFLRAAIGKKDEAKVKELLAEGANPNDEYAIGYAHKTIKRTVLILAASVGHPGIVQILLSKGANVNAKGLIYGSESGLKFGTALEAAESSKHAEVAAMLRKAMNATAIQD